MGPTTRLRTMFNCSSAKFHLLSLLLQLIPHGSDLASEVVVLLLLVLQLGELLRALKGVEEEGSEEEISNIDHK